MPRTRPPLPSLADLRRRVAKVALPPVLTRRQAAVLRFVIAEWLAGRMPTFRHIGARFDVNVNAAAGYVRALRNKGFLRDDSARLQLTDAALALALGEEPSAEETA